MEGKNKRKKAELFPVRQGRLHDLSNQWGHRVYLWDDPAEKPQYTDTTYLYRVQMIVQVASVLGYKQVLHWSAGGLV